MSPENQKKLVKLECVKFAIQLYPEKNDVEKAVAAMQCAYNLIGMEWASAQALVQKLSLI